jgi:hypothetical protein
MTIQTLGRWPAIERLAAMDLRADLPLLPSRMKSLPLDRRGYPVPWFVAIIDGEPDFRVIGAGKLLKAHRQHRCWICGDFLGRHHTFAIGPMCAINRVSSEPPSHHDCAEFAARACPFLTRPEAKRREAGLPEERQAPAGIGLARNPGVVVLWSNRTYQVIPVAPEGMLFDTGAPELVEWFCEGRPATRAEARAALMDGMEILREMFRQTGEGVEATAVLEADFIGALELLPS